MGEVDEQHRHCASDLPERHECAEGSTCGIAGWSLCDCLRLHGQTSFNARFDMAEKLLEFAENARRVHGGSAGRERAAVYEKAAALLKWDKERP